MSVPGIKPDEVEISALSRILIDFFRKSLCMDQPGVNLDDGAMIEFALLAMMTGLCPEFSPHGAQIIHRAAGILVAGNKAAIEDTIIKAMQGQKR